MSVATGEDHKDLFTNIPTKRQYVKLQEDIRVTYTGHAGFIVETPDVVIMVDPVVACRDENDPMHMTGYSELPPRIDYICLTHSHQDHTHFETLLQLRHKTSKILIPRNNGGTLADPSTKLMLQQLDFEPIEFEDLEALEIPGGSITSIPFLGEHGDLNIRSKSAWLVDAAIKKMFFGAESSCLDKHMYEHIHKAIGDLDMLAIGMECVGAPNTWMYGALYTDAVAKNIKETRRLNGANSAQAGDMAKIFNPKQNGTYLSG